MPTRCTICRAVASKENVSFFRVPKDEEKRQRWIKSCGFELNDSLRICQKHFDQVDFIGPPFNKKCRLMPGALPKRFLERRSKTDESSRMFDFSNARSLTEETRCSIVSRIDEVLDSAVPHIYSNNNCLLVSNDENNQITTFAIDPLENISETVNEIQQHNVIISKDEVEISVQDIEFDDHHKKKCGEIVLDTYDNTFTLNCFLCSTICLDLITFSEHVKKQHDSLLEQCIDIENELDADTEESFEVDNSNLGPTNVIEVNHDIQNSQSSSRVSEENYISVESNIETDDSEIEIDSHEGDESSTNPSTECNSEIDFKNHAVVAYFIKLLKQKPFIWNTAHPHRKRKIGLISLIDPLSEKFPRLTFTYRNLFTLLRAIRVAFQNELKQIKETQHRGIEYTPQLWFFDKLKFVENLNDEAANVQHKIDGLEKIAMQLPLNIFADRDDCEKITIEFINHYKEQPDLWNINHPDYSGKFQYTGFQRLYGFLSSTYTEIECLPQIQFKKALEEMLKWFTAVEDIRLHMEKLNQPFNSYYPRIYEALEFLRGHVPPFRCHICDKIFYHEKMYVHHKGHCGVVVHECQHCCKRFLHAFSLKEHMSTHSNECPFVCTICGKAFKANRLLFEHLRRHEVKPFKCNICQRGYRTARLLRVHQKSHLGIRDKVCHICGKTFTSSKYLYNHRLSHFKENNRKCKNCGVPIISMALHKKNCMARLMQKGSTKRLKKNKGTSPVKADFVTVDDKVDIFIETEKSTTDFMIDNMHCTGLQN